MKQILDVEGMSCSACVNSIESTLKRLDGINSCEVRLLNNQVLVNFDDDKLQLSDIVKSIEKLGYHVVSENNNVDKLKQSLIITIVLSIILMDIAMGHMLNLPLASLIYKYTFIYVIAQILLVLPIFYLNRQYFIKGFKALIKLHPTMDTLIAIGSSTSFIYGVFIIIASYFNFDGYKFSELHNKLYFESSAMILAFVSIGKYLETKNKEKTKTSIKKLIDLQPDTVFIKKQKEFIEVTINQVKKGDIIMVKPGMRIPLDGLVKSGQALVDESVVSGESIPILKSFKDECVAGSMNVNGVIELEVINTISDSSLTKMIEMIENAANSKAPIAKVADKVSYFFVPSVILIAIITFIFQYLSTNNISQSIDFAISVLVISCPCALGLATPLSIMVATGSAANLGMLIKNGEVLETSSKIDVMFIDKTGTISEGKPTVVRSNLDDDVLSDVALIESKSLHPIANAIAQSHLPTSQEIINFEEIHGLGIKATINDRNYVIGSVEMMNEMQIHYQQSQLSEYLNEQLTPVLVACNNEYVGIIGISDPLKKDADCFIKELKKMKIKTVLLSGDRSEVVEKVRAELGIDYAIGEVKPQGKLKYVYEAKKANCKVMMIGDGINDALALNSSDVSLAMASGSDIALDSADVVLRNNDLMSIIKFIRLSKLTLVNIYENLFWALLYNTLMIPIAAGVFYHNYGIHLIPMFAALAMSFSSIFVVSNALRLKYKLNKKEKIKMKKVEIIIDGMMCEHCKKRVEDLLNANENVEAKVDLANKKAIVEMDENTSIDILVAQIESNGYKVVEVK